MEIERDPLRTGTRTSTRFSLREDASATGRLGGAHGPLLDLTSYEATSLLGAGFLAEVRGFDPPPPLRKT